MRAQCFYSYQLALWPLRQRQASNLVTTTLAHAARFSCLMAGVNNSRPCGGPGDKNVYSCHYYFQYAHRSFFLRKQICVSERPRRRWGSRVTAELWFLSTELGTCHLPRVQNLDVVPRFMESVCTLASLFATFICCTILLHGLAQYSNYTSTCTTGEPGFNSRPKS